MPVHEVSFEDLPKVLADALIAMLAESMVSTNAVPDHPLFQKVLEILPPDMDQLERSERFYAALGLSDQEIFSVVKGSAEALNLAFGKREDENATPTDDTSRNELYATELLVLFGFLLGREVTSADPIFTPEVKENMGIVEDSKFDLPIAPYQKSAKESLDEILGKRGEKNE